MNGFDNQAGDSAPSLDGYFAAEVVDNNDPDKRQRVKVRVPNLLEGPLETLPWVGPLVASSFGVTADSYSIGVPAIGSILAVKFQDGDLNHGVYAPSLHTSKTSLSGEHSTNYPFRRGWKDPAGNYLFIDTTPGATDAEFHHNSGSFIKFLHNGDIEVESPEEIRVKAKKIYLN